jgi:hypothetical protein
MENLLLLAVFSGLIAWLCAVMAESRGRNKILWAILGVAFGGFSVIVLLLIGTKREKTV